MEEYGEEIGEKGGKIMGWYRLDLFYHFLKNL